MTRNKESENQEDEEKKSAIANTDETSWDRIRRELFPTTMFRNLPEKEANYSDLLVDTIANSSSCYPHEGDVVARFDEIFELVFRIHETLEYRYEKFGVFPTRPNSPARRKVRIDLRPTIRNLRHLGSRIGCIWSSGGNPDDPVMIDCVGFVLWADSGFHGFNSNLRTRVLEYSIRSYFRDIIEEVCIGAFSLSWQGAFEAYELTDSPSQEGEDSEFRRIARRAILGWMLFPERKPFSGTMEDLGSEAIARMIFKEFDEDRRYQ